MRLSLSFKILPGVRVGVSRGTGRRSRTRLTVSERVGPVRVSESTRLGKPRRTR